MEEPPDVGKAVQLALAPDGGHEAPRLEVFPITRCSPAKRQGLVRQGAAGLAAFRCLCSRSHQLEKS
jgi:hypothetical protein